MVTEGVVSQIESLLDTEIDSHPYLRVFLGSAEVLGKDDAQELISEVKTYILEELNPAYQELATFLREEYLPQSRTGIGIKEVPNGREWYELSLIHI